MGKVNYKVLATLLISFLAVQLLGIYTGNSLSQAQVVQQMPAQQSIVWFALAFLIATSLMLLGLKFFKGKMFFGALFAFIIFIGSQVVFETFLPALASIVLAAGLVGLRYIKSNAVTHNLAIGIAIAGIAAQLGLMLPIEVVLILFVALSAYDIYAVYGSKHMIKLFKGLSKKGVLLSLAIPEKRKHVDRKIKKVKPGKGSGFIMLGTGDIAFPLILSVAALSYGLLNSFFVVAGSLVGVSMVYLLLSRKRKPLPALPPIALFSVVGFLISLFI